MAKPGRRKNYQLRVLSESGPDGSQTSAAYRKTPHALVRVEGNAEKQPKDVKPAKTGPSSSATAEAMVSAPALRKFGRFKLAPETSQPVGSSVGMRQASRDEAGPSRDAAPTVIQEATGLSSSFAEMRRKVSSAKAVRLSKLQWTRDPGTQGSAPSSTTNANLPHENPSEKKDSKAPSTQPLPAAKPKVSSSEGPQIPVPKPVYCPEYCRGGYCRQRRSGCPFKHDPTKRAICRRWLGGYCPVGDSCPLQHQRVPGLMPLCLHYIKVQNDGLFRRVGYYYSNVCDFCLLVSVKQDEGMQSSCRCSRAEFCDGSGPF